MNQEDILDKQIENYIHTRMSLPEKIEFEKTLDKDESLKKSVAELIELKSLYDKTLFEIKLKLKFQEQVLKHQNFFSDQNKTSENNL